MRRVIVGATFAALLLAPATADAQGGGSQQQRRDPAQNRGPRPEQRLGEAMAEIMKLTDQQRPKFAEVNGRFMERERSLNEEEKVARGSMRNLLCSGDTTRGADLSRALDQVLDIQKRRHQLFEEQQKELSTFLTPYQRARFMGGREVIMGALGGGRGGRGGRMGPPPGQQGGPPPGGPPPGGRQGGRQGGRMGPPPDICAGPQ